MILVMGVSGAGKKTVGSLLTKPRDGFDIAAEVITGWEFGHRVSDGWGYEKTHIPSPDSALTFPSLDSSH